MRPPFRRSWPLALGIGVGCAVVPTTLEVETPDLAGREVRLTLLHTSDIHSRLLGYDFDPSYTDNLLGLADCAEPYGGIARIATIVKRERERAGRVLHLDSGDCFQGAIIFNEFQGQAEMEALTELGLDAAVIGNHEFDAGAQNLAAQAAAWAGYDLLAANYDFEDADEPWATELERIVLPSALYDLDGLRVGVIGLGNLSSLTSIYDEDNSMGIRVLHHEDVVRGESARLRAQGADIIVVLSHMGLDDDIDLASEVDDVDIVLGGHHHVAIDPPLVVTNVHTGKRIPVVHSGAFAKFVGRVDLVVRDGAIVSHAYELFPVDRSVPEDPAMLDVMEPYEEALQSRYDMEQVLGTATEKLTRYGSTGGDSMLGNLAADAIRDYPGVETEIAITNTLGIRADIGRDELCSGATGEAWPITLDDLYNSMPFDNTITTMFLSGRELQETLDYATSRSTDRGCQSQIQVSGISFDMNCCTGRAENVLVNGMPLDPDGTYELATNNYIAHGGSGFTMLERNTTQSDTDISVREVVRSAIAAAGVLPQPGIAEEDGRIRPTCED